MPNRRATAGCCPDLCDSAWLDHVVLAIYMSHFIPILSSAAYIAVHCVQPIWYEVFDSDPYTAQRALDYSSPTLGYAADTSLSHLSPTVSYAALIALRHLSPTLSYAALIAFFLSQ